MNMPPQSALMKIALAVVVLIVARFLPLFGLTWLVGMILSVLGSVEWAKAKGLSPWWGALGLITLIGWIILYFVPGRSTVGLAGDASSNYPR